MGDWVTSAIGICLLFALLVAYGSIDYAARSKRRLLYLELRRAQHQLGRVYKYLEGFGMGKDLEFANARYIVVRATERLEAECTHL